MSDMVDVAAQAIYAATHLPKPWERLSPVDRSHYRRHAQAAIDSLNLTQFWAVGYGDGYIDGEVSTEHLDSAKEQLDEAVSSGYADAHLCTFWATGYRRVEVGD